MRGEPFSPGSLLAHTKPVKNDCFLQAAPQGTLIDLGISWTLLGRSWVALGSIMNHRGTDCTGPGLSWALWFSWALLGSPGLSWALLSSPEFSISESACVRTQRLFAAWTLPSSLVPICGISCAQQYLVIYISQLRRFCFLVAAAYRCSIGVPVCGLGPCRLLGA